MIGFAALGGASIEPEVSAWIAVFVLPLNSAVNPVLYTISAIDCGRCVVQQVCHRLQQVLVASVSSTASGACSKCVIDCSRCV